MLLWWRHRHLLLFDIEIERRIALLRTTTITPNFTTTNSGFDGTTVPSPSSTPEQIQVEILLWLKRIHPLLFGIVAEHHVDSLQTTTTDGDTDSNSTDSGVDNSETTTTPAAMPTVDYKLLLVWRRIHPLLFAIATERRSERQTTTASNELEPTDADAGSNETTSGIGNGGTTTTSPTVSPEQIEVEIVLWLRRRHPLLFGAVVEHQIDLLQTTTVPPPNVSQSTEGETDLNETTSQVDNGGTTTISPSASVDQIEVELLLWLKRRHPLIFGIEIERRIDVLQTTTVPPENVAESTDGDTAFNDTTSGVENVETTTTPGAMTTVDYKLLLWWKRIHPLLFDIAVENRIDLLQATTTSPTNMAESTIGDSESNDTTSGIEDDVTTTTSPKSSSDQIEVAVLLWLKRIHPLLFGIEVERHIDLLQTTTVLPANSVESTDGDTSYNGTDSGVENGETTTPAATTTVDYKLLLVWRRIHPLLFSIAAESRIDLRQTTTTIPPTFVESTDADTGNNDTTVDDEHFGTTTTSPSASPEQIEVEILLWLRRRHPLLFGIEVERRIDLLQATTATPTDFTEPTDADTGSNDTTSEVENGGTTTTSPAASAEQIELEILLWLKRRHPLLFYAQVEKRIDVLQATTVLPANMTESTDGDTSSAVVATGEITSTPVVTTTTVRTTFFPSTTAAKLTPPTSAAVSSQTSPASNLVETNSSTTASATDSPTTLSSTTAAELTTPSSVAVSSQTSPTSSLLQANSSTTASTTDSPTTTLSSTTTVGSTTSTSTITSAGVLGVDTSSSATVF